MDEHSLACSADGKKVFAGGNPGGVFISTNSGLTWQMTSAPSDHWWEAITCSADGTKVVAGNFSFLSQSTNQLYISTNSGTTWSPTYVPGAPQDCLHLASSSDGTRVVAILQPPIAPSSSIMFGSIDGGVTWAQTGPYVNWSSVAISADGYQVVAAAGVAPLTFVGGGIYISKSVPNPMLSIAPENSRLLLSWPVPSVNFVVQQSSDFGSTNWTDIPVQPALVLTNLSYQASLAPTGSPSFFRLKVY